MHMPIRTVEKEYDLIEVLTLDFRTVGRALGTSSWLIKVFSDSLSKEGKRGVPGGVRSLNTENILNKYRIKQILQSILYHCDKT